MGDSEIARLSRQIYQKHQRAIDLIYEHRPDPQGEVRDLLAYLIHNEDRLAYKARYRNRYIFFFPTEWDVSVLNPGNYSHGFFRFVFHNNSDGLVLFLESSPGDEEVRQRLFEMGQKDESLFGHLEDPATGSYPKLYRRTFLTPEFYDEVSDKDRETEIRLHWAEFLENDLPRIDAALKQESWIWHEPDESE